MNYEFANYSGHNYWVEFRLYIGPGTAKFPTNTYPAKYVIRVISKFPFIQSTTIDSR